MSSPTAEHAYNPAVFKRDAARRLQALGRWRTHSRRIAQLRVALPAAIVALLVLLVGWAAFKALMAPMGLGGRAGAESIRMVNPRFFGRDQGGKPFSVTASSAVRDNVQFQRIYVEKPVLVIGASPSIQTVVSAGKGVYREDTRILTLDDNVHVHDSQGNDFISAHAVVNAATDQIDSPERVVGHGPIGRITSASFSARDGGAHIYFNGGVVGRIEQGGARRSAPPAAVAMRGPR